MHGMAHASMASSLTPYTGTIPAFRRRGVRTPLLHAFQTAKLLFPPTVALITLAPFRAKRHY